MIRKFALALGLAGLIGTAGALATTSQAEAGWQGANRHVVHRTVVRDVHRVHGPRAHRHHRCVVKKTVRMTPRGPVKVVKRICR